MSFLILILCATISWAGPPPPPPPEQSMAIDKYIKFVQSAGTKDDMVFAEMLKSVFHITEIVTNGPATVASARFQVDAKISQLAERRLPPEDIKALEALRSRLPPGPEAAWAAYQTGDLKAAEKMLEAEFAAAHKRALALKAIGPGQWEPWPSRFFVKILREIVSKKRHQELLQALEVQVKHIQKIPHYVG